MDLMRMRLMKVELMKLLVAVWLVFDGTVKSDPLIRRLEQNSTDVISGEVCQMETFDAACGTDEVVITETALLGRLKLGKCVTESFGFIGCSLDVMPEMELFCSGRQKCEVKIDKSYFKRVVPCHTDLSNALWVSYRCMKVIVPTPKCDVIQRSSGFLSSHVTETSGCGQTDTPWTIKVGPGQKINVTLYDFYFSASTLLTQSGTGGGGDRAGQEPAGGGLVVKDYPKTCRVYATIRETYGAGRSATVCGWHGRVVNVFTSTSDQIEIRILSTKSPTKPNAIQVQPQFLLHYSALGCSDPTLPEGVWKQRSVDTLLLGCQGSDTAAWQLTCTDNGWRGTFGDCLPPSVADQQSGGVSYTVIIMVIAFMVSFLILLVGVVCIKRRMTSRSREMRCLQTEADHYDLDYSLDAMSREKMTFDPNNPDVNTSSGGVDGSGNDYARMRLQRLAHYTPGVPPPYDVGYLAYGTGPRGGGYLDYQQAEHIYESPDSFRRDEKDAAHSHYTPRIQQQQARSASADQTTPGPPPPPGGVAPVGSCWSSKTSSPSAAQNRPILQGRVGGASSSCSQKSASKSKSAGNYSL